MDTDMAETATKFAQPPKLSSSSCMILSYHDSVCRDYFTACFFGFRISDFFRPSGFGFRISTPTSAR